MTDVSDRIAITLNMSGAARAVALGLACWLSGISGQVLALFHNSIISSLYKAVVRWKFLHGHRSTKFLNAGCGGYLIVLQKIYS